MRHRRPAAPAHRRASSTARPCLGRALGAGDAARDRRPCFRPIAAAIHAGAEHGLERDGRGDLGREAALLARLGQRGDEARDIGRAGAGDRADRGELRLVRPSTARSRAARTGCDSCGQRLDRHPRCTARSRRGGSRPAGWAWRGRLRRPSGSAVAKRRGLDPGEDRDDRRARRQPAAAAAARPRRASAA